MIAIYAIAVTAGAVMLVAWIMARGFGDDDRASSRDPDVRFGLKGRMLVAATLGFGLGGMSASFGGWNAFAALVAAIGGAVLLGAAVRLTGDRVRVPGE